MSEKMRGRKISLPAWVEESNIRSWILNKQEKKQIVLGVRHTRGSLEGEWSLTTSLIQKMFIVQNEIMKRQAQVSSFEKTELVDKTLVKKYPWGDIYTRKWHHR